MFATNDFLYNTNSVTGGSEEPETGFSIFGNHTGLSQVSIRRDWYDDSDTGDALPAYYAKNSDGSGQWVDLKTGVALSSGEVDSIRHYQMKITYDERVNDPETQPPGLPRGGGTIFAGFQHWEELQGHQAVPRVRRNLGTIANSDTLLKCFSPPPLLFQS